MRIKTLDISLGREFYILSATNNSVIEKTKNMV